MKSSNNLIFATMHDDTKISLMKMVKFVLLKIIFPLFSFTAVCISLIFLQISVKDYCFYPELCSCENILIYFYTIVKETLQTHGAMMLMLYYGAAFVSLLGIAVSEGALTPEYCGNAKLLTPYCFINLFNSYPIFLSYF